MSKKKKLSPKDAAWANAKKLCRLNAEDIRKAKELGFKPKSLIKNIPNKNEQWKDPVKIWIRDLHYERFGEKTNQGMHKETYQKTHKKTHKKTLNPEIFDFMDNYEYMYMMDDNFLTNDDNIVEETDIPYENCDEIPF